ncbi:hypothetical protein [Gillisia sp. CAL575]|uniref:hypothetical protein n=1 Tax=Gillisia sp. CAL575 TaxID=985255 RepID=UPI0003A10651|nr:hypothetical protein [Gillisia sp. CAL575]
MTSSEFKIAISEVKEALKGKTLTISFVHGDRIEELRFTTLRGFGNTILKLEKIGAGFGFIKVGNDLVQRGIYKNSEFQTVLNRGNWNEVFFLATTVKFNQ